MDHSEIFNFARNFSVMVKIRGPVSLSLRTIPIMHNHDHSLTLQFPFSGPKRNEDEKTRFSSLPVIISPFFQSNFRFFFFSIFDYVGFLFFFWVLCSSGETTLSASGLLVPEAFCDAQVAKGLYGDNFEGRVLVVTVASVVEPFLSPQHRQNIPQVGAY